MERLSGQVKIYATQPLPESVVKTLKLHGEVSVFQQDRPMSRTELLDAASSGVDVLITAVTDRVDAELMDRAPNLRVIANFAVGIDNIDVKEATKRGIFVTHTPHVLSRAVAELVWGMILCVARRIVPADRFTRSGRFTGWSSRLYLGQDVYRKTLGIIGMGRIGLEVARIARGFDMKVLYSNRRRRPDDVTVNASFVPLLDLMAESDIVVALLPHTEETYHLLGENEFSRMKPNSIFINAGRGTTVKEKALIDVLQKGKIWGAGLDVYEFEPEVPAALLELDNVVLLPHIGSATFATRESMAMSIAEDIIAVLHGERPRNLVNAEVKS